MNTFVTKYECDLENMLIRWRCSHSTIRCCSEIYAHLTQPQVLRCQHYYLSNRTITVQRHKLGYVRFIRPQQNSARCMWQICDERQNTLQRCLTYISRITVNNRDTKHEKRNPPWSSTIRQSSDVSSNQHLRDARKPQADPGITITKFWQNKQNFKPSYNVCSKCSAIR
jgi:hypothetical protein